MNPLNIDDRINFKTIKLKSGEEYETTGNKIITVVDGKISGKIKKNLNTFESSVYHSGKIVAEKDSLLSVFDIKDLDIILNKIDVDKDYGEFCRSNWSQLRELWDVEGFEKVDLYRSKQEFIEYNGTKYGFNLWFCGKEVDCLFHNQHDFIEVHTGIAGDGYMQKAEDLEGKKLIETHHLGIGRTHMPFNIEGEVEENGNPKYPIHRYLGGPKGNIWLVIEKY